MPRYIASIGVDTSHGDCADVVDGYGNSIIAMQDHSCLSEVWSGGPRRHDTPGERCPPPPAQLYACRKSFPPGAGSTACATRVVGEVTLGLVVRHARAGRLPPSASACSAAACASASSAAMASRIFPNRPSRGGQLLRQLISTLVFAVPPVFLFIHWSRAELQQLRHLRRQLRFPLLHPLVTHRLAVWKRSQALTFVAVQRHMPPASPVDACWHNASHLQ